MNLPGLALCFFGSLFLSGLAFGKDTDCALSIEKMAVRLKARNIKFTLQNDHLEILPSTRSKIGEIVESFAGRAKVLKIKNPKVIYDPNLRENFGVDFGYHPLSNSFYVSMNNLLSDNPLEEYGLAESLTEFNFYADEKHFRDNISMYAAQIIIPNDTAPIPFTYLTVLIARKIIEIAQKKGDQEKIRATAQSFLNLFDLATEERKKSALTLDNEIFYQSVLNELSFFERLAKLP